VSVNHFTAAFSDSYAGDILISLFWFFIYLWHCKLLYGSASQ